MTRSEQLLEDVKSHGSLGAPELNARRIYGDSLVESLIRRKYVEVARVDIGNGFHFRVLKVVYR